MKMHLQHTCPKILVLALLVLGVGVANAEEIELTHCYSGTGAVFQRWPRLSEQIFRVDKWNLCRG